MLVLNIVCLDRGTDLLWSTVHSGTLLWFYTSDLCVDIWSASFDCYQKMNICVSRAFQRLLYILTLSLQERSGWDLSQTVLRVNCEHGI